MKFTSSALLVGVLSVLEVVNGQAIDTSSLGACAASCMNQAVGESTCASTDQTCICTGNDYENLSTITDDLETCLFANCPDSEWDNSFTVLENYCYGSYLSSFTNTFTDSPVTFTDGGSATTVTFGGTYTTPHSGSSGSSGSFSSGSKKKKGGLSTGAKAGIAIGVVLLVILAALGAVLFFCMRARNRKRDAANAAGDFPAMDEKTAPNGAPPYASPGPNMAMPMDQKQYPMVTTQAVPPNATDGYHYVDQNGNPVNMGYAPAPGPEMPNGQQGMYQPGAMWGVPAGAAAGGAQPYYNMPPQQNGSPSPQNIPAQLPYQPTRSPQPMGPPPGQAPLPSGSPPPVAMGVAAPHAGAVELSPDSSTHFSPVGTYNTGGSPASLAGQMAHQSGQPPVVPGQVYEMGAPEEHKAAPVQHQPTTQHVVPAENGGGSGPVELA